MKMRTTCLLFALAAAAGAGAQEGNAPGAPAGPPGGGSGLGSYAQHRLLPTNVSALAVAVLRQLAGTSLVVNASALPPRCAAALPDRAFETVRVLPPAVMCDGFSFTVFVDHRTQEFWVLRTGGFAGVHELFGPGRAQKGE